MLGVLAACTGPLARCARPAEPRGLARRLGSTVLQAGRSVPAVLGLAGTPASHESGSKQNRILRTVPTD